MRYTAPVDPSKEEPEQDDEEEEDQEGDAYDDNYQEEVVILKKCDKEVMSCMGGYRKHKRKMLKRACY